MVLLIRHCAAPLIIALALACGGRDTNAPARPAKAPLPSRAAESGGFQEPEAARYDSAQDVYFVSNGGGGSEGFISRVRPDGTIDSLHFIIGGRNGVTLQAPRGLALVGDTLWVADSDAVRAFDAHAGAPLATVDLRAKGARRLSDIAATPSGALYVTDSRANRVFRIGPDRSVSVALEGKMLSEPTGITWDARAKRLVIVPFGGSSAIFALRPGDTTAKIIGHTTSRMVGVQALPDGRLVVTSWKDSTLTILNGDHETIVRGLPSAARLGIDVRRGRVAIPLRDENRLDLWAIPGAG